MMMMMILIPGIFTYGTTTYRYSFRRYFGCMPYKMLSSSMTETSSYLFIYHLNFLPMILIFWYECDCSFAIWFYNVEILLLSFSLIFTNCAGGLSLDIIIVCSKWKGSSAVSIIPQFIIFYSVQVLFCSCHHFLQSLKMIIFMLGA